MRSPHELGIVFWRATDPTDIKNSQDPAFLVEHMPEFWQSYFVDGAAAVRNAVLDDLIAEAKRDWAIYIIHDEEDLDDAEFVDMLGDWLHGKKGRAA